MTELEIPDKVYASQVDLGIGANYTAILMLPEGLEVVGDQHDNASKADVVVIPASVKRIRAYAFSVIERLRRVVF